MTCLAGGSSYHSMQERFCVSEEVMIGLVGTRIFFYTRLTNAYNGSVFVKLVSESVIFSVFIYCAVSDDSFLYFCTLILSIDSVPQFSYIPWQKLTSTRIVCVLVDSVKLF